MGGATNVATGVAGTAGGAVKGILDTAGNTVSLFCFSDLVISEETRESTPSTHPNAQPRQVYTLTSGIGDTVGGVGYGLGDAAGQIGGAFQSKEKHGTDAADDAPDSAKGLGDSAAKAGDEAADTAKNVGGSVKETAAAAEDKATATATDVKRGAESKSEEVANN